MVNPERVLKAIAAIEAGDSKMVRMMIKAGVPANHIVTGTCATDQSGLAHLAAACGQFEIFETLITAGADIDAFETCSWRPPKSMLECASSARLPSLEIVRKVLAEGHPSQEHLNQSLLAACYGHIAIVDVLLAADADPNFVDQSHDTPLIVAILSDSEDVALRLLEAGADATGLIRNKDREPFWKKSIHEVVRLKGMSRLLARLGDSNEQSPASEKPQRARKPKTIEDCWKQIDDWLVKNRPAITLPSPFDFSKLMASNELLLTPTAEQIKQSLYCHDGTGEFAIVEMPEDASYALLSVSAALEARDMIRAVMESERDSSSSEWWSEFWWPLADNGAGDLLVADCSDGKTSGQVLKFSHETRQATRFKKSVLDLLQSIAANVEWLVEPTP
jgi:cell wall assembly regulator SMI1